MTAVIVADNLTRDYGVRRAVDRVSFEVGPNEVMGLLGPNGSGKSTILRILAGYLRPTSGTATVAGFDVLSHGLDARRQLGYVPEDVPLYTHMRVTEFLGFMGRTRGLYGTSLVKAVDQVVERLSLGAVRSLLIGKLSRGYRQRVAIAQALLGKPKLLVLDEPTNGLDPRQIIELRELIRSLARELSVLVTSHILAEIERVAHRAAILLDGKLLTVHRLTDQTNRRLRVRLTVNDEATVRSRLRGVAGVSLVEALPARGNYVLEYEQRQADAVRALVQAGLPVEEVASYSSGLEELFLRLTEGTPQ
ncbi:MAG TPA: ABC transporter ATP-binding protein [Burkholderiales bacterium]|nr:ABC transporter ATP-binding protein [Burkholderiales bacterium]